ncbi:hypothetical protein Tco_1385371 [Tanacetum coccineum]
MPPKHDLVYPRLDDFVEVNKPASESVVEKPIVETNELHGNPQQDLKDKGVIDSGCSRHMTRNRSYLTDYEEIDEGFVAFRGNSKGGKITEKDFKLTDESHVLLKVPRKDNMYNVDLKNVFPQIVSLQKPHQMNLIFGIGGLDMIQHQGRRKEWKLEDPMNKEEI